MCQTEPFLPRELLHKVVSCRASARQYLQVAESCRQRCLSDGIHICKPFPQPVCFPAGIISRVIFKGHSVHALKCNAPSKMPTCPLHLRRLDLLVPMLLSKAFSLTASSLLGSESAPASTSFDVYRMILRTCTIWVPVTHPCKSLQSHRHAGREVSVSLGSLKTRFTSILKSGR